MPELKRFYSYDVFPKKKENTLTTYRRPSQSVNVTARMSYLVCPTSPSLLCSERPLLASPVSPGCCWCCSVPGKAAYLDPRPTRDRLAAGEEQTTANVNLPGESLAAADEALCRLHFRVTHIGTSLPPRLVGVGFLISSIFRKILPFELGL